MGIPKEKPASSLHKSPLPCHVKMAPGDTITRLSAWDQAAMRSYIRVVLCFEFDNTAIDAAMLHLQSALDRLACQRPDFAGTIEVHTGGIAHLRTSNSAQAGDSSISLTTVDISSFFAYASFADFKAASFPPGAFVAPYFNQPCVTGPGLPGVPVALVKAFTISGGLLLGFYFNHALADGDGLRIFLDALSSQTCNTPIVGPSTIEHCVPLPVQQKDDNDARLQTLLGSIPEYMILDEPVGPTVPCMRPGGTPMDNIAKTGKIFVFRNDRLGDLRHALQTAAQGDTRTSFTSYTCLAALTWTHIAQARLADKNTYVAYDAAFDNTALLQTMVNWKSRAFQGSNTDYFGNATAVAATRVPTRGLLAEAATDQARLAELVSAIDGTIKGVNDDFVRDRTELFSRVPDPRLIGLRFDPRTPQDLGFNTWRFFGADTQWMIPGVATGPTKPAVVRRMQDVWNMSGALILPAKAGSSAHELLVTLPTSAMDLLCQDDGWMCWVDRVIG